MNLCHKVKFIGVYSFNLFKPFNIKTQKGQEKKLKLIPADEEESHIGH